MKNIFTTITAATLLLTFITSVHAQTVTTSPTESIRDSVKKQVDQELSQIKKSVAKKGYVGTITAKSDGTITTTLTLTYTTQSI
jgi:predicted transcriptional regulator